MRSTAPRPSQGCAAPRIIVLKKFLSANGRPIKDLCRDRFIFSCQW
jgi:hypothetical protein